MTTTPTLPSAKRSKYILIVSLIFVVVVIVLLKILTPPLQLEKSQLTQKNFDGSTSTFQLQFVGKEPAFPTSLPIGQVSVAKVSESDLLAPLISHYQLEPEPGDPLLWSGPDYVLIKDEGSLMYTLSTTLPAERSAVVDENAIIQQAESLATKLFPESDLKVIRSDSKYLAGSEEQKEVAPQRAEVISLVLAPTMGNYPVMIQNNSLALMQMEFDSSQKLITLSFLSNLAGLTYSPGMDQDFELFSIDRAVQNINRGDGAIIDADSRQVAKLDLNTNLSGQLNRVELEYRSTDSQQLIPYYRFSGPLQSDGIQFATTIITPAIDLATVAGS